MSRLPDPWPSLKARIEKIEKELRRIGSSSPFFNTGIHPDGDGGMSVDGQMAGSGWDGDLDAGNVGTTGWAMNATRAALPELLLRPGSIGNEALTNPTVPQSVWKGTTANFGLAVAWSTLVSEVLTVPSGVTSAQIIGFVRLVATNTTATKDYLYSDFDIGGQSCGGFSTPVEPGDPGTSFCSFARTIDGLTAGGTITLSAYGSTSYATWASTNNVCQISASVTWYR